MYVCVLSRTVGFKPAYKTKLSEFLRKIPIITLLQPIPPGDHCMG